MIQIRGAREHNLKGIDVRIGDGLTVVTGVSGSGKTSLAFDTLYHEARRRFLEVFAVGAGDLRLAPTAVDTITGLGPAVAMGQNLLNRNPNSSVATASGLHPFLRLLYTRFGTRTCAECGGNLAVFTDDEIVEQVIYLSEQPPLTISTVLVHGALGSHATLLRLLAERFGTNALVVDGAAWSGQHLHPETPHRIELRVAQFTDSAAPHEAREALELAVALGGTTILLSTAGDTAALSRSAVCAHCGRWFQELRATHFNQRCPRCQGEGCAECQATGLHPLAAAVQWQGLCLPDLLSHTVDDVANLLSAAQRSTASRRLFQEIGRRIEALRTVGLGYVTLDRSSPTLSRGEAQRVRIAVALTGRLEDMVHILDEPTVGQHPADVARLLPSFRRLCGSVVYVEHDRTAASEADHVIDLGPGAGDHGGSVVFQGSPAELWKSETVTGRHFSLRDRVPSPASRPAPSSFLTVRAANLRNLQSLDVPIPLGRLTVITGVSGSGKSTFVEDVLVASLRQGAPKGCRALEGAALKPVFVDQSPIGRNPRSNPATYTKLAEPIRDLFAAVTGLSPSHFSFNRPEGACPTCQGMGAREVRMRYLPSTWVLCEDCDGHRFSDEVLAARVPFQETFYSIADLYARPIGHVGKLLQNESRLPPRSRKRAESILQALCHVGLGYLSLGQPSPSLSGGEAQRVKLAKYLGRPSLAGCLLVLDEPSTGLHPEDLGGLLRVLDRLVRSGATVVVVEHNADVIRSADWIIDLGPGAGPNGGRLLFAGPLSGLTNRSSPTADALRGGDQLVPRDGPVPQRRGTDELVIRNARANNLAGITARIPKGALTVVTGISGSGKSSLVHDVMEVEARRRFLEMMSLYERQGQREGPEAPVEGIDGLGVAMAVGTGRDHYNRRATVGTCTALAHHLAAFLAAAGQRRCPACSGEMIRAVAWECSKCGHTEPLPAPRHFLPATYAAACRTCHGVGSLQVPNPAKLITKPHLPLCKGAMYSPGFFPKGYLCEPYNHGYYMVRAIAKRYEFDPAETPWRDMTEAAQNAFLFGDPEPIPVTAENRKGEIKRFTVTYPGFYGFVRDWDVGGTYTDTRLCPACGGGRLRPEYLAVTLESYNAHELSTMPLTELAGVLAEPLLGDDAPAPVAAGLKTARRRVRFLLLVGLGYLNLHRVAATLSAGEAQRVRLAGLLSSSLTSLTVLLDEPTRGLHPSEVNALLGALKDLRDEGNTVIVVEHDELIIRAADHLLELGPGAGKHGGHIVAQGSPKEIAHADTITGRWLRAKRGSGPSRTPRKPDRWLTIRGARAFNLRCSEVRFPLGLLTGVCGVSGSGKSTLLIETIGRALAPVKHTTSVAREPLEPGAHDGIEGRPKRTVLVDQSRAGMHSPMSFLNLGNPLRVIFSAGEDARALGVTAQDLGRRCSVCLGRGFTRLEMGFLPDVEEQCEVCRGTGCCPEAWEVSVCGVTLPDLFRLTLEEVFGLFGDHDAVRRPLQAALDVGLGYLVLQQPGLSLSGGEAQRLKIAAELCKRGRRGTLYILDEPTIGQHLEDVGRLVGVLHRLVDEGHSVVVSEHHPHLLAACDWLVELGPGGGPDGGLVIAQGTPSSLAAGSTPIAPYLRALLEETS